MILKSCLPVADAAVQTSDVIIRVLSSPLSNSWVGKQLRLIPKLPNHFVKVYKRCLWRFSWFIHVKVINSCTLHKSCVMRLHKVMKQPGKICWDEMHLECCRCLGRSYESTRVMLVNLDRNKHDGTPKFSFSTLIFSRVWLQYCLSLGPFLFSNQKNHLLLKITLRWRCFIKHRLWNKTFQRHQFSRRSHSVPLRRTDYNANDPVPFFPFSRRDWKNTAKTPGAGASDSFSCASAVALTAFQAVNRAERMTANWKLLLSDARLGTHVRLKWRLNAQWDQFQMLLLKIKHPFGI